jgi:hypothetical protein
MLVQPQGTGLKVACSINLVSLRKKVVGLAYHFFKCWLMELRKKKVLVDGRKKFSIVD